MLELDELNELIKNKKVAEIVAYIKKYKLVIDGNKIKAPAKVSDELSNFWDKRQLVKKINLNSLNLGRVYQ